MDQSRSLNHALMRGHASAGNVSLCEWVVLLGEHFGFCVGWFGFGKTASSDQPRSL
jgi:hypothetical protein